VLYAIGQIEEDLEMKRRTIVRIVLRQGGTVVVA